MPIFLKALKPECNPDGDKLSVVFRKIKDDDGFMNVFAVFPEQCEDYCGEWLAGYDSIGGHHNMAWGYYWASNPATPAEYESLLKEIQRVYFDFDVVIYQMITPKHRAKYKEQFGIIQAQVKG